MKIILKAAFGVSLLATLPVVAQTKKSHPSNATVKTVPVKFDLTSDELFLKRNPSIKTFSREPGYVLVIQKKDGTKESYSMDRFPDEQSFLKNYGKPPLYKSVTEPTAAGVSN